MATIESLSANGVLVPFAPRRLNPEKLWRPLWLQHSVVRWLETYLITIASSSGNKRSPYEQVDDLFDWFSSGRSMRMSRDFCALKPLPQDVWELQTDDVTFFGFFAIRNAFVILYGDLRERTKNRELHQDYGHETARVRTGFELPSYITGALYDDILSDIIE